MSASISDTTLVGYHHGRLPSETAQEVRSALLRDPGLRSRYRALTQEIDFLTGLLNASFARPQQPALEQRIRSAVEPAQAQPRPAARSARRRRGIATWQALAASLLVAVGLGLGLGHVMWDRGEPARDDAIPALQAAREDSRHWALEYVSSGSPELRVADDDGWKVEVTPIRTFRNSQGAFCREFIEIWQVAGGNVRGQLGVACREQLGGWHSVANLPVY